MIGKLIPEKAGGGDVGSEAPRGLGQSLVFPRATPRSAGSPLGSVLAPIEGASGKSRALAWPSGMPKGAPVPFLSCLAPWPADVQPLLVDLAQPFSLTCLLLLWPPEPSRTGRLCPARVVCKAGWCQVEVLSPRGNGLGFCPVLSPSEPCESDSAKWES